MGYAEGVFLADLLDLGGGTKIHARLERSYTLSLHLPRGHEDTAAWRPPQAPRGRAYDVTRTSWARLNGDRFRVARRIGRYQEVEQLGHRPAPGGGPDDAVDGFCVDHGERPKVIPCPPGTPMLRPIFVNTPLVVPLASATACSNHEARIEARDVGERRLTPSDLSDCDDWETCARAFKPAPEPPPDPDAATVLRLRPEQQVEAILRYQPGGGGPAGKLPVGLAYTALVLYRSDGEASAPVAVRTREKSSGMDGWTTVNPAWPSTFGGWKWAQIYPVYPAPPEGPEPSSLEVRIGGPTGGMPAPFLNVAGFIDGPPHCFKGKEPPIEPVLLVCPDEP
jgi:hypothetical protein